MTLYGVLQAVEKQCETTLEFDPESDLSRVEQVVDKLTAEPAKSAANVRLVELI